MKKNEDDIPKLQKLTAKIKEATEITILEVIKEAADQTPRYRRQLKAKPCEATAKELDNLDEALRTKVVELVKFADALKKNKDSTMTLEEVEKSDKQLSQALGLLDEAEIFLARNEDMMKQMGAIRSTLTDLREQVVLRRGFAMLYTHTEPVFPMNKMCESITKAFSLFSPAPERSKWFVPALKAARALGGNCPSKKDAEVLASMVDEIVTLGAIAGAPMKVLKLGRGAEEMVEAFELATEFLRLIPQNTKFSAKVEKAMAGASKSVPVCLRGFKICAAYQVASEEVTASATVTDRVSTMDKLRKAKECKTVVEDAQTLRRFGTVEKEAAKLLKAFEEDLAKNLSGTVKDKVGSVDKAVMEFGAWREMVKEKEEFDEEALGKATMILLKVEQEADGKKMFKIEKLKNDLLALKRLEESTLQQAKDWQVDGNENLKAQLALCQTSIVAGNTLMVEYGYVTVLFKKISDAAKGTALLVEDKARQLRNVSENKVPAWGGPNPAPQSCWEYIPIAAIPPSLHQMRESLPPSRREPGKNLPGRGGGGGIATYQNASHPEGATAPDGSREGPDAGDGREDLEEEVSDDGGDDDDAPTLLKFDVGENGSFW